VVVPEAGGVVFDDLEEGEVLQVPPRDPAPLFISIESGQQPEPEQTEDGTDFTSVLFQESG